MFIAALFTTAKTWKQPKCPSTDKWIEKIWYTCTVEYYSAIKKKEIPSFCDILKRYLHPHVHSSTIYNSQDMETTKVSIHRQMNRENMVYMHSGILFSHKKKKETPSFCDNMDQS